MMTKEMTTFRHDRERISETMDVHAPGKGRAALDSSGFTLIELLVVVTILGVLASIAFARYAEFKEMAKVAVCKADIRALEQIISAYNLERASLPPDLDVNTIGPHKTSDPWKNPYVYHIIVGADPVARQRILGTSYNTDYDLYSMGSDNASDQVVTYGAGHETSNDDIIRVDNGNNVVVRMPNPPDTPL